MYEPTNLDDVRREGRGRVIRDGEGYVCVAVHHDKFGMLAEDFAKNSAFFRCAILLCTEAVFRFDYFVHFKARPELQAGFVAVKIKHG